MKLATIDFEGDALHKSINQQIFPKGCHFDPGTRVWCATISYYNEGQMFTKQFVTKLNGTREIRNEDGTYIFDNNGFKLRTVATHEKDTKVPLDLYKGSEHITLKECVTEHELYEYVRANIVTLLSADYTICSKGYGKYNYDNMLFLTLMNRYKDEKGTSHSVYYPSLLFLKERIDLAKKLHCGISIWELGQGLDYFMDLFSQTYNQKR